MGSKRPVEQPSAQRAIETIEGYLAELRANRPGAQSVVARSAKGAGTVQQILAGAHTVFVRDGYAGLSFRKVAQETGLSVGNINYYFATKQALVVATLQEALIGYLEAHVAHFTQHRGSPVDILLSVVGFYVRDSHTSHPLFFQMWGYAGASDEAKVVIRDFYRPIGRFIYHLVRACNPAFDHEEARDIVFQIFSLEQGMKLFIGMGPTDDIAIKKAEQTIRETTRRLVGAAAPASAKLALNS